MKEFFRGWRRKTGCLTLMVALLLAGSCARGNGTDGILDSAYFVSCGRQQWTGVMLGGMIWAGWDLETTGRWELRSESLEGQELETATISQFASQKLEHWRNTVWNDGRSHVHVWTVDFRSAILPLGLLSAYWILWKPRKRD